MMALVLYLEIHRPELLTLAEEKVALAQYLHDPGPLSFAGEKVALVQYLNSQGPPMRYVASRYTKPQCCSAVDWDLP